MLALRLARREMRSGLGGFRLFIACLALGVGAVACASRYIRIGRRESLYAAVLAYAFALLCKEVSVAGALLPPLVSSL